MGLDYGSSLLKSRRMSLSGQKAADDGGPRELGRKFMLGDVGDAHSAFSSRYPGSVGLL